MLAVPTADSSAPGPASTRPDKVPVVSVPLVCSLAIPGGSGLATLIPICPCVEPTVSFVPHSLLCTELLVLHSNVLGSAFGVQG